jgi:phosphoserine phosphatase
MNRLVIQHPRLSADAVTAFSDLVGAAPHWQGEGLAGWSAAPVERDRAMELAQQFAVDAALTPQASRLKDFRLITFDMDSTLITNECIDEIAEFAGRKSEVATITEAAMRGEIADFDESLRRRVALLAGLPESVLARVYEERITLSPGAQTLIDAVHAAGLKVLLVSGGFTYFSQRLRDRLGIDEAHANRLEISNGQLTGRVLGEIVNGEVKKRRVLQVCEELGCSASQAIVVGDGANDLKMMSVAGLSVAYRAKPVVRMQTTHAIDHCGLDAILNFFGPEAPGAR